MPRHSFHEEQAKRRIADAVAEIERQSSAEVVIAVRPSSGFYRHADYLFGFALMFADLLLFLFYPRSMRVDTFPLEALLVFWVGATVSAWSPPLRRLLSGRSLMARNVERAARATFVDMGVSATKQRRGILVYVSLFERAAHVVSDVGVVETRLGEPWLKARQKLEHALEPTPDVERFAAALAALAKPLTRELPVQPGDVNELPDEASVE
jgi:putative membrane protein